MSKGMKKANITRVRWMMLAMAMAIPAVAWSQKKSDGFVSIFDGKTLTGWEGDKNYWRVEGGSIVGEITADKLLKANTFIIWRGGEPGDFELKLEYRITKDGNSGINYRSEQLSDVPFALKGYQADIDGMNNYTGQNYEERKRTTLAYRGQVTKINSGEPNTAMSDHIKNNAWTKVEVLKAMDRDSLKTFIRSEGWNEVHLIVKGNRMQHFVNGVLMSEVTDNDEVNRMAKGLIGVQVHVGPPMKVEYRNIRMKSL